MTESCVAEELVFSSHISLERELKAKILLTLLCFAYFFHLGNEFQTPVVSINAIYPLWLVLMLHSPAKWGES